MESYQPFKLYMSVNWADMSILCLCLQNTKSQALFTPAHILRHKGVGRHCYMRADTAMRVNIAMRADIAIKQTSVSTNLFLFKYFIKMCQL